MNIQKTFLIALAFGLGAASACQADNVGKKLSDVGKWAIYQDIDPATGEASCTGLYQDDGNIQLARAALYFSLSGRGGVKAYTTRYDNLRPNPVHLATKMETDLSIAAIRGPDFATLTSSTRFRIHILTAQNQAFDYDLDLTDIAAATAFINGPDCRTAA